MKTIAAVVLLAVAVLARPEPPAPRYGPPAQSYSAPSSQYGPPGAQFNSAPSSRYGPPAAQFNSAPSTQYGAPSAQFNSAPSTQYGAPSAQFNSAPSSQYGAPAAPVRSAAKVSSRLGGGRGSRRGPSAVYGAPAVTAARFAAPSSSYGAPAPSSSYGAPSAYAAPAPVYGPPGYDDARARLAQDDLAEPANYEFSYAVDDAYSGSNFGHQEDRQEDSARGEYRVLLPDGRTQIVEYEADQEGFRPQIRYEEPDGPYPASQRNQGGPY